MDKDLGIGILNDLYGVLLTEHRRNMVSCYYDCDFTLAEIGENYGITRQAVCEAIRRAKADLLEYEKKLMFGQRLSDIKTALTEASKEKDDAKLREKLAQIINTL